MFDESGVTRDRTYKRAWYCGKDYDVVDTGGLVFDDKRGDIFAKEVCVICIALDKLFCAYFLLVIFRTSSSCCFFRPAKSESLRLFGRVCVFVCVCVCVCTVCLLACCP